MSRVQRFLKRLPVFTLLTGLSLAIGLLIPTVFEWGEKPAARSRHPEMEMAAFLAVLISLVIAAVIWFLNKPDANEATGINPVDDSTDRIQFSIRQILIATTVVAITIAVAPLLKIPNPAATWTMVAVLIGIIVWTVFQRPLVRSRMGATLACMFLPFAWIVPTSVPFGHVSGMLPAILFGPGLVPALLLRRGQVDESVWIAVLFVFLELGVGIWLARRCSKLAVVYALLTLGLSAFTSFVFHALYRM